MRHIIADIADAADVPPPPVFVERRRTPDRRKEWRGGRRDSDWVNRPPAALTALELRRQKMGAFKRAVFSALHLW